MMTFEDLKQKIIENDRQVDLDKLTEVYQLAEKAHEGQKRVSGEPYITHPLEVTSILVDLGMDTDTLAAALLHDVVEDTSVTLMELQEQFPEEVTEAVRLLTRREDTDYFDYIRAVRKNPVAKAVKLADIAHNSDGTRFAGCEDVSEEVFAALREKYRRAEVILLDLPQAAEDEAAENAAAGRTARDRNEIRKKGE